MGRIGPFVVSYLAVLGDHCELLIEAIAFEDDAPQIRKVAQLGRSILARQLNRSGVASELTDLQVLYVADQIDPLLAEVIDPSNHVLRHTHDVVVAVGWLRRRFVATNRRRHSAESRIGQGRKLVTEGP